MCNRRLKHFVTLSHTIPLINQTKQALLPSQRTRPRQEQQQQRFLAQDRLFQAVQRALHLNPVRRECLQGWCTLLGERPLGVGSLCVMREAGMWSQLGKAALPPSLCCSHYKAAYETTGARACCCLCNWQRSWLCHSTFAAWGSRGRRRRCALRRCARCTPDAALVPETVLTQPQSSSLPQ